MRLGIGEKLGVMLRVVRESEVEGMANSEWINDDRTFCNQECDAECYRNSNHIYYKNQPHSMADFRYTSECEKFFRKPTNYERIVSMSVEEMAEFLQAVTETCAGDSCKGCPMHDVKKMSIVCNGIGIKQWLESEVEK